MTSAQNPRATYRLQFNQDFTFAKAADLVPYLASMGISHCYASPYLRARPSSTHGYDIIDHNRLNPEIGSCEDYERFVAALHRHGMGQILDVVPNHMGVMGSDNAWWLDVLENGEASSYAEFFDIDWQPLKDELQGKVLVPVLNDQYGSVIDRGELQLAFDREKGEFSIVHHGHRFPVDPREYPRILGRKLERLQEKLGAQNEDLLELQSLISAFNHLPGQNEREAEKTAERQRDKEIHKKRLAALATRSAEVADFIAENVRQFNGVPGDSKSFDDLHELIKAQAFRLAYWRVAADDINYRRFFDINDLAGLRMENETVFEATHRFVLDLVKEGKLNGLRIDHPDGLYDPAQYFRRLQQSQVRGQENPQSRPLYVVVEKILTADEKLPLEWPIDGTTGYEFSNLVNGLFVDSTAGGKMEKIYRAFTGRRVSFENLVYRCKKLVMHGALTSELNVLANLLSKIALSNRHTCDFTLNSLREALSETVACFPVYRTYITENHVSETDAAYIEQAVACAKARSAAADATVLDFVRDALLTHLADGRGKAYRADVVRFAMKFQQFTGAVMAKGLEDTCFYRYNRLVSLNEVGSDPKRFGVTPETFHQEVGERAAIWPHSMLSTSTHDSKRSEDVRARINVLSEIPDQWRRRVRHWRDLNHAHKRMLQGAEAPSPNDEYLFYQTLLGVWPGRGDPPGDPPFCCRIKDYMLKAIREAKEKTSWARRNKEYEEAVTAFVQGALAPGSANAFLQDFLPFQEYVAYLGTFNSLSQTLIKLTVPGLPDIYQGNEVWDFSLVDPDNRRPVDYARRRRLLAELQAWTDLSPERTVQHIGELLGSMSDGRIKLYVIWKTLSARNRYAALFQEGEYVPLRVEGPKANHLIAFSRRLAGAAAVVVAPRLFAQLLSDGTKLPTGQAWKDTQVELPSSSQELSWQNVFTRESATADTVGDRLILPASRLLAEFPLSLLIAERH